MMEQEPKFKLKESQESSSESDGNVSQASTAILPDYPSSEEVPPIIRGASLLEEVSPKHKPTPRKQGELEEVVIDDYDDDVECLPPSPVNGGRSKWGAMRLTPLRTKDASDSIAKGNELTLSPSKRLITLEVPGGSSAKAKLVFSDSCESCSEEIKSITQSLEEGSRQNVSEKDLELLVSRTGRKESLDLASQEDLQFSLSISQAPPLSQLAPISSQSPSSLRFAPISPQLPFAEVENSSLPSSQVEVLPSTSTADVQLAMSFESQRIFANNTGDSVTLYQNGHSFCTPDNAHHSTPHNYTGSTEKIISSAEVSKEISPSEPSRVEEYHMKFGKVLIDRKKKTCTVNMENSQFEFERFLLKLGPEVGTAYEQIIEQKLHSPCSGYSADVSSSSSRTKSSSSSGTELLKTAITNSTRVAYDPLTHLTSIKTKTRESMSTVLLDDENKEVGSQDVSYSQVQTQQIEEMQEPEIVTEQRKETPKSGRKRTKTSVRRTGKKARSLNVIDEDVHDGKTSEKKKPLAKRQLEEGSSRPPTPRSTKKQRESTAPPELEPVSPVKKLTPLKKATRGRKSIYPSPPQLSPVEGPNKTEQLEVKSPLTSEIPENSSILALGEKIEESHVAVISDQEISSEADTAALKLQRKQFTIEPGMDVYAPYGRFYYPAKIGKELSGGKWAVNFLDGLKSELSEGRIVPIKFIPRGTPVFGDCDDRRHIPGIIVGYKISRNDVDYIVQLDRGETLVIPRQKVILSPNQVELLVSVKVPGTPSALDLDNVLSGKRRRTQRTDLQPATPTLTPRRRGKKDPILDTSTLSESTDVEPKNGKKVKKQNGAPRRNGALAVDSSLAKVESSTPSKHLKTESVPARTMMMKQIFISHGFLLTKKDPRPEGEEDDMSETETTYSSVEFDKAKLKSEIEARGGIVFECFTDSQMDPSLKIYLISNRACRTEKYIYALAAGFAPVHNAWIMDCIKFNSVLSFKNYLLPAGIHTTDIIEWMPRGKIFHSQKILLVSEDESFIDFWRRTLIIAGSETVTIFEPTLVGSPMDYSFVVAKMLSEQTEGDERLLRIVQGAAKLKGYSNHWAVFCLVHGQLLPDIEEPLCDIW